MTTPQPADLVAAIRRALTTTLTTGCEDHEWPPAWREHGTGHEHVSWCALCAGDVEALVEAVTAAVRPLIAARRVSPSRLWHWAVTALALAAVVALAGLITR